jgi:hypothetical protein
MNPSTNATGTAVALIAILLDKELVKRNPKEALRRAADFLRCAEEVVSPSPSIPAFGEAFEASLSVEMGGSHDAAGYVSDLKEALRGHRTGRFLILSEDRNDSTFHDHLTEKGAPEELLELKKCKTHLKRLRNYRLPFYRASHERYIISKDATDEYFRLECDRIKEQERLRKGKNRRRAKPSNKKAPGQLD